MKYTICLKTVFILIICSQIYSQEDKHNTEINSSVPELYDFHEIIYPIWHTAYPEKDFTMLKEMVKDVNQGAEKIYTAELPGILRDKKDEWVKGVENFRVSVEKYNKAMEGTDETEMLLAAEELHSRYEKLVRIIRPVTREIDDFHKVLYMIYHHYWPDRNREEFSKAVDDLELRAEELNNCVLPGWASDKSDKFKEHSLKLYESVKKLNSLNKSDADESEIEKAVENVHNNYVNLEGLF